MALKCRRYSLKSELEVANDTENYAIEIEPHGEAVVNIVEGRRVVEGPPGTRVTLRARSLNADYRITDWVYTCASGGLDPKYDHSKTTTAVLGGYARPRLSASPPDPNRRLVSFSVRGSQGGTVAIANAYDWTSVFAGSILAEDTGTPITVDASAGLLWTFDHWEGRPETSPHLYISAAQGPMSFGAVFQEKEVHIITTEVSVTEGGPAGPPECGGYVTVDPARCLYAADPNNGRFPIVTVEAHENPGYRFLWWDGSGVDTSGAPIAYNESNPLSVRMDQNVNVTAVLDYVPIEVYQGARRILETNGDIDGDGIPDDIAYISPAPAMPELVALVVNGSANCMISWRIEVVYNRADVTPVNGIFDPYYYPVPGAGSAPIFTPEMPSTVTWDINFVEGFVGGDATITYQFNGEEDEFRFRVLGLNPADPVARAYIDAEAGAHWYAYAIAKHESLVAGQYYCQFNPPGAGREYEPNKDATQGADGFGMMMVDPPDVRAQLWHWQMNVDEGIERLGIYRGEAADWIDEQVSQQQQQDPSQPLANEVFTYNGVNFQAGTARTPTDACTIQRYNGAAEWIIYWNWNEQTEIGFWANRPNGYVDAVCGELDN